MKNLRDVYVEYIKTQIPTYTQVLELSTDKYLCFLIQEKKKIKVMDNDSYDSYNLSLYNSFYVWLGKKGAVYITPSCVLKKDAKVKTDFENKMKNWALENLND